MIRGRPPRSHRRDLLRDPLIIAAILAVAASFALGYRLDWNKTGARPMMALSSTDLPVPMPAGASESVSAALSSGMMTPDKWRRMTETLYQMARRYPAPVAVYLQDFKTGETWTYNPDRIFRAASLIKLPLMVVVFFKIKEGGLSLDQRLVLSRDERTGGSGVLKWSRVGASFSVYQLLIHLISESDNTAANMLLDAVSLPYAQEKFRDMGLAQTRINKEGMSLRSGDVVNDNYTTAREMNMLLVKIYRGELVDPMSSRLMLDILRYKKPEASRLAKGLPRGWVIAHKTGLERRACHDSAIFLTPYGDYSLTVLTGENRSYHRAKNFITRLGRLTFAYYEGSFTRWRYRYYGRTQR